MRSLHPQRLATAVLVVLLAVSTLPSECRADWWDDFVDSVHTKLVDGANFLKEKAGPAVREKFDTAKAKLQDPQTHEDAQVWVKEVGYWGWVGSTKHILTSTLPFQKAFPVIEDNWNKLKSFINEEVAPQAYKIYQAGVEANERQKKEKKGEFTPRPPVGADSHEN